MTPEIGKSYFCELRFIDQTNPEIFKLKCVGTMSESKIGIFKGKFPIQAPFVRVSTDFILSEAQPNWFQRHFRL